VLAIRRDGGLQMRQRIRVFALRFQGFPQLVLVFEVAGIERGGALQMRNTEAGIILQPIRGAQMILRRRELRVQIEGSLEAPDGLLAAIQNCQQKAHFVLQMRRFGDPGRPPPDRPRVRRRRRPCAFSAAPRSSRSCTESAA
jgi:hypothetical protein